jgi:hypothetical protein
MSSPSPGWYPDPNSPGNLRFYDGGGWTRSVVPVPADGQLTKEMIATGRKIMREKTSSKLQHASFTPTASEAPASGRRAHAGASGLATSRAGSSSPSAASAASAAHARDKAPVTGAVEKAAESPTAAPAQRTPGTPSATVAAARRAAGVKANIAEPEVVALTTASSGDAPSTQTGTSSDSASNSGSAAGVNAVVKEASAPNWTKNRSNNGGAVNKDFSATEVQTEKPAAKVGVTSRKRIALIAAAFVVVAALLAGVYLMFIRDNSSGTSGPSDDYRSLGLKDEFGCKELAREVIELSQNSDAELEVTAIDDVEMVKDNRAKFTLPTVTGSYEVAFECQGTARYADGSTETLTYDISADKNSRFWTSYPQREK